LKKAIFIAPDNKNKNDKAYSLFVKVLIETKKIALGKIALRDKEYIAAIRPYH
jgi:non-homologous end joining protein Ku